MTEQQLEQGKELKRIIGLLMSELEKFDNPNPNGINVFLPNVGTLIEDVRQDFLLQRDLYNENFRKL